MPKTQNNLSGGENYEIPQLAHCDHVGANGCLRRWDNVRGRIPKRFGLLSHRHSEHHDRTRGGLAAGHPPDYGSVVRDRRLQVGHGWPKVTIF